MNILDEDNSKDKYSISEHLKHIKDSTLWMKFVGITIKIISGMSFLSLIIQITRSALTVSKINLVAYLLGFIIIGVIYYIFDLVHKSSEYFERYFNTNNEDLLRKGLDCQSKYWKAAGYLTIFYLGLIVLLIFGALVIEMLKK
jgi:hypothetical protein